MNVLLMVPPIPGCTHQTPEIGLGYLAAALTRSGHTVRILQAATDRNLKRVLKVVGAFQPDIIGIKVYSPAVDSVVHTCYQVRSVVPNVTVVLGGPHVSALEPGQIMSQFGGADFAVRGDGEIPLSMLADRLESGRKRWADVPGLVWRDAAGNVQSRPVCRHARLDDYHIPIWQLMDPKDFRDRHHFWTPESPAAPIITSRGCNFSCAFCSQNVVTGKGVRYRSAELVMLELELLQTRFGIRQFDFLDDNFVSDPDYTRAICQGILDRNWRIQWTCFTRFEALTPELVKLMEAAGCRLMAVGFESGSQRILDRMHKRVTPEFMRDVARMVVRETGIRLFGTFILGYPTETEAEVKQTIDYALSLPLLGAGFFTFLCYPGCLEYRRLIKTGQVPDTAWRQCNLDYHMFCPGTMPEARLRQLFRLAHLRFYGRPRTFTAFLGYSGVRWHTLLIKAIRKFIWRTHSRAAGGTAAQPPFVIPEKG